jgi:CheY-like chemotaxis protein
MSHIVDKNSFDSKTILLVEDYADDVLIMKHALQKAKLVNPLQVVNDGDQAIAYLSGVAPYDDRQKFPLPVIVFLDLTIRGRSGLEILKWIRAQPRLKKLTIHILTASDRPAYVEQAAELGANSYLVKPSKMETLIQMLENWHAFARFTVYPEIV